MTKQEFIKAMKTIYKIDIHELTEEEIEKCLFI